LEIDCGSVYLVHVTCGKPWPIPEELEDTLCMSHVLVQVWVEETGDADNREAYLEAQVIPDEPSETGK
jgi:hypothetical protein